MVFHTHGLLFDLDGTLVDSTIVVVRHWSRWAQHHGIPLDDVLAISHGVKASETMRRLAPHIDIEAEAAAHMLAETEDTDGLRMVPGADQLLASLPTDQWTIVTSCPPSLAVARLQAVGLPVPTNMVTGDLVSTGKPHPAIYRLGAERLGLPAHQCLAFEDAPAGIESAHAAGMPVIAITTTFAAHQLNAEAAAPDYLGLRLSTGPGRQLQVEL
jgi:sugar-phosphatase